MRSNPQGEYISPEKIENVYTRSPLVAQAFVYGDSLQPNLVAVVVPDPETLLPWAAARGLAQNMTRLISDPSVVAAVLNSMLEEGRTSRLQGFEQVCQATPCQTELAAHQRNCACKQNVLLSHDAPWPLLAQ